MLATTLPVIVIQRLLSHEASRGVPARSDGDLRRALVINGRATYAEIDRRWLCSLCRRPLCTTLGVRPRWLHCRKLLQRRGLNFPLRMVVPKPMQKPHPPLWVACSQLETLAKCGEWGMGALGFQFVSADAAHAWVHAYYNAFVKRQKLLADYKTNPNIALVSFFMCAKTDEEARARADGDTFFQFPLRFYGQSSDRRRPPAGTVNMWEEYQKWKAANPEAHAAALRGGCRARCGCAGARGHLHDGRNGRGARVAALLARHAVGREARQRGAVQRGDFGRQQRSRPQPQLRHHASRAAKGWVLAHK